MIAWKRLVNPSEKALAIGPTTKNVNGTVMSNVKKGTAKTLMTSGSNLSKEFLNVRSYPDGQDRRHYS